MQISVEVSKFDKCQCNVCRCSACQFNVCRWCRILLVKCASIHSWGKNNFDCDIVEHLPELAVRSIFSLYEISLEVRFVGTVGSKLVVPNAELMMSQREDGSRNRLWKRIRSLSPWGIGRSQVHLGDFRCVERNNARLLSGLGKLMTFNHNSTQLQFSTKRRQCNGGEKHKIAKGSWVPFFQSSYDQTNQLRPPSFTVKPVQQMSTYFDFDEFKVCRAWWTHWKNVHQCVDPEWEPVNKQIKL